MQENSNQSIKPQSFTPAGSPTQENAQNRPEQAQTTQDKPDKAIAIWLVPAVLAVIALLVLIVPAFDKQPQQHKTASNQPSAENVQIEQLVTESTPDETPWADAQLLKARRDTQEILAELLGVQKRLESLQVELWAQQDYERIKVTAEQGDALYKERQFDQSLEKYSLALDTALRLDTSVPEVALKYQQEGERLLALNQSEQAIVSLSLSDRLMPGTETTQSLLQQANVRQRVLGLIEQSNDLARNQQDLEKARSVLDEAQALDGLYAPVAELITDIDEAIIDRDFRAQMSKGYELLSTGNYQQASMAFKQAAKLKPRDSAPLGALQQVEAAKLNTQRQGDLNQALELEAKEQWQAALSAYSSLLAEDSSLTAAQLGKLRTQARFNLDSAIEEILNNPLSLQSENRWQAATRTLADARGIIRPGQRLMDQIEQLQKLIIAARTPVVLKLSSDGLTEVEIYRIGKLGNFKEQAMNLNPGKYVIVGRRNGYQDVRVELEIDGSEPEIQVPVVCTVAI